MKEPRNRSAGPIFIWSSKKLSAHVVLSNVSAFAKNAAWLLKNAYQVRIKFWTSLNDTFYVFINIFRPTPLISLLSAAQPIFITLEYDLCICLYFFFTATFVFRAPHKSRIFMALLLVEDVCLMSWQLSTQSWSKNTTSSCSNPLQVCINIYPSHHGASKIMRVMFLIFSLNILLILCTLYAVVLFTVLFSLYLHEYRDCNGRREKLQDWRIFLSRSANLPSQLQLTSIKSKIYVKK